MKTNETEVNDTQGSAVSEAAPLDQSVEDVQEPGELPAVLTIEETARFLRISRATAYRAVRRGELPCIHIGRNVRIPRGRLLQLLEQSQVPITRRKSA